MDQLSKRHRLFVDSYSGDALEAMQMAGYVGQPNQLTSQGQKLLQNPLILQAIQERSKYMAKCRDVVATREERQSFWTNIMRNQDPHLLPEMDEFGKAKAIENIPIGQRLKAAELLGKSEADFTENLQVTGNLTITDVIQQAYQIDDSEVDAIEAEYELLYGDKEETEEEDNIQADDTSEDQQDGSTSTKVPDTNSGAASFL